MKISQKHSHSKTSLKNKQSNSQKDSKEIYLQGNP